MPKVVGLAVLLWVALAATAEADTVFLKNGESVWGSSTYEDGDAVIVVRPSGKLRIPKADVSRVDGLKSSLPPFYSPPGTATGATEAPGGPGAPVAPGAMPAPGTPGATTAGAPASAGRAPAPPAVSGQPTPPPPGAPVSSGPAAAPRSYP